MQVFKNNAASTLAVPASDTAGTIEVSAGHKFPQPTGDDYFYVTLSTTVNGVEYEWEICKCTQRLNNILFVERGQEGTTAKAWSIATVELRPTAGSFEQLMQRSEHTSSPAATSLAVELRHGIDQVFSVNLTASGALTITPAPAGTYAAATVWLTSSSPGVFTLTPAGSPKWRDQIAVDLTPGSGETIVLLIQSVDGIIYLSAAKWGDPA